MPSDADILEALRQTYYDIAAGKVEEWEEAGERAKMLKLKELSAEIDKYEARVNGGRVRPLL